MQRLSDWEPRLATYLDGVREAPFDWGAHDCCTFVFGAIEAMTGEDRMPEFRGRYSTQRGAAYALRKFGAGTLRATLTAKLGEPIPPALTGRGDVVMLDGSIGICFGPVAVFVGSEGERAGLVREAMPAGGWEAAWHVPFGMAG